MALPSSGALSVNDIHIEAGGSSGALAALNDSDIRSLIGKASGATNSINEYYGASSGVTVWIRVWGARGGYVTDFGGPDIYGKSRECGWTGKVASGTVLYYANGDYGQGVPNPYGAAGGAGTIVYLNNNFASYPLVISGGGGAGGIQYGGAIGTGGHASNGPGHGGNASPGGSGPAFDAQGGRANGSGGAHGDTRGVGFNGSSWTTTANRGRGGDGGDGLVRSAGGQNGWSQNLHFAGGHGSERAGDGGGGGGGGGYGGGGGGGSAGWAQPGAAGSSEVFNQAASGATYQSSNGGEYRNYAGRVMIYVSGTLVHEAVSNHTPLLGNYTVP